MAHVFDWAAIAGHLVILATTLGGFWFQWVREDRQHRWHCERYEALRKQIDGPPREGA